jgi:AraC family transcriptional regulator, arabinose operon regulatory protein
MARAPRLPSMLHGSPLLTGHFVRHELDYGVVRPSGVSEYLLFCTVAGGGLFRHRGGSFTATAGELTLYDPGITHEYHTDPQLAAWEFTWAHVRPPATWLPLLEWPHEAPGLRRLRPDPAIFPAIAQRLHQMHDLAIGHRHHRLALAMNALEDALLQLDEHNPASPAHRDGRLDPRLRLVLERCSRDLSHPWSIEALAAIADLSPSRFAHLFAASLGESPRRYVERIRLERAHQLLRTTDWPVSRIAETVGFTDPFHFTNRFHAVIGTTPTAARK